MQPAVYTVLHIHFHIQTQTMKLIFILLSLKSFMSPWRATVQCPQNSEIADTTLKCEFHLI